MDEWLLSALVGNAAIVYCRRAYFSRGAKPLAAALRYDERGL
jgi:hypothetical protein